MIRTLVITALIFLALGIRCQTVVDSCFTSVDPLINFISSDDFANVYHADMIEWDGDEWIGSLPAGMMTIPPPTGEVGCRAFGLGSGSIWTPGGERIAFRIVEPLVNGQSYSFTFTYVSHGVGSDGIFSPKIHVNHAPDMTAAEFVGSLLPVGTEWETHNFSFSATENMNGSNWIIVETDISVSTGIVSSFCSDCVDCRAKVSLGNDTTICAGETLILDATNSDATYLWQDTSVNAQFEISETGKYWVDVITDECTLSDTIDVVFLAPPDINFGNDTTLCPEATLYLNAASEASNFLWNDELGNEDFIVTQAGNYWVLVSNFCGVDRDSISVSYFENEDIDFGADITLCEGNDLILDATTPDATYLWQDNSENAFFTTVVDGQYWVDMMKNGCVFQDTIAVNFVDSIHLNFGNDTVLCQGSPLVLDATVEEANYLWQDNSVESTFEVSTDGMYWVKVSNICENEIDSIQVTYVYIPNAYLGEDTVVCQGEMLILGSPPEIATYEWQDGADSPTFTARNAGLYWLQIDNVCGTNRDTIVIYNDSPLFIDLGQDTTICQGSTIVLESNVLANSYLWQNGSTAVSLEASQTDSYWLAAENACGEFSDSVNIVVLNPPKVNLGMDATLCPIDSVILDASYEASRYLWQDNSTNAQFTARFPGEYSVVVTNQCGTAGDVIEFYCIQVQLPNVFTPNGDGYNDFFIPFIQGDIVQYSLVVFNRWGQSMFKSNQTNEGWDGRTNEIDSPAGVYFAVVSYVDYTGYSRSYSGELTLLR